MSSEAEIKSFRQDRWHVPSADGRPAYYPMEGNNEEVRRIVEGTKAVEAQTAELMKGLCPRCLTLMTAREMAKHAQEPCERNPVTLPPDGVIPE